MKMSKVSTLRREEQRPRLLDVPNIVWHAYHAVCVYRAEKRRRRQRKRNKRNGIEAPDGELGESVLNGANGRHIVRILKIASSVTFVGFSWVVPLCGSWHSLTYE